MAESTSFDVIQALDENFDAIRIDSAPKYPGMYTTCCVVVFALC